MERPTLSDAFDSCEKSAVYVGAKIIRYLLFLHVPFAIMRVPIFCKCVRMNMNYL